MKTPTVFKILGHTKYKGRACLEQIGFFGSDHSPVVLELEKYWIARLEANKKVLQAIATAEFASCNVSEVLFDDNGDVDDELPVVYDVYDEASF